MKVQLILCSYNGARYLMAQLDSILKQTETRFRLLISDDCSTDGTAELAAGYVERFPERVELWRRTEASGGAARHFLSVLKAYGEKCCAGNADMGADGSGASATCGRPPPARLSQKRLCVVEAPFRPNGTGTDVAFGGEAWHYRM